MIRRRVLLFIQVLLVFTTNSQIVQFQTSFYNINSENGLQSSEIYKVGEDSRGNIWFCTDGGVTRYDGYYYHTYTEKEGLLDNIVFDFYEDLQGRIWFLSFNSLLCYYKNGKIYSYKYNDKIKSYIEGLTPNQKSLYIDKNNNLYYSIRYLGTLKISSDGHFKQLPQEKNTICVKHIDYQYVLSSLCQKKSYKEALGLPFKIEGDNGTITLERFDSISRIIYVPSPSGKLSDGYFTVHNEIRSIDKAKMVYKNKEILNFGFCDENKLWIGTFEGVVIARINKDKTLKIENNYLKGEAVTNVFADKGGGYWISTLGNGVYYSDNFNIEQTSTLQGLGSNNVVDIVQYDNETYVSFLKGWQNVSSTNSLLYESESSKVRLGSLSNKLLIGDQSYMNITFRDDKISFPLISDLYIEKEIAYICSIASVFKYNSITNKLDTLYNGYNDKSKNGQVTFKAIGIDESNNIILGNINGLYQLNKGKLNTNYYGSYYNKLSVTDVLYHKDWGTIVSTSNDGIYFFDKNQFVKKINQNDGLVTNNISCLKIDSLGTLYIGTNLGINYIKKNSKKVNLVSKNQGLMSTNITVIYPHKDYLLVGTKKGLFKLSYSIFYRTNKGLKSRVFLDNVILDDKKVLKRQNFNLPNGITKIDIRFKTLNHQNWFSKKYEYRLNENESWIQTDVPEIVLYKPSGGYNIKVRYLKNDYSWSEDFFLAKIAIDLPIWKQGYFWVIIILILTTFTLFLMRNRYRKVADKFKLENEFLSLEQRMQNARMNPHFIFNSLNSIQSQMIFGENKLAQESLLKFSNLLRSTLKNSGAEMIEIKNEVTILNEYLEIERIRYNSGFNFVIETDNLDETLKIPNMIIQPFVENAIIYGVSKNQNGKLEVKLNLIDEMSLEVLVINNGKKATQNFIENSIGVNSNAIGITMRRLEIYNKMFNTGKYFVKLVDDELESELTIVKIVIPIIKFKE